MLLKPYPPAERPALRLKVCAGGALIGKRAEWGYQRKWEGNYLFLVRSISSIHTGVWQWRRQNFAPGGGVARARGARVPTFLVTKSSGSESHLALGLQKRIWLKFFLQQPATVTGDFDGLTSS